jgi:ATP-binding cassette subfamily B protein
MQKNIISLFWRISRPYRLFQLLAIFFPILAVTTNNLAAPYVLAQFLNKLQSGTVTFENSASILLAYGGLLVLGEIILWRLALYFCWTFEIASMRDLYSFVFRKLSRESLHFHSDRFTGSLVSQASKLQGSFERFWDMIIWSITPMLTMTFGAIIIIATLGYWQYSLVILATAVLFATTVLLSSRFLAAYNTREAQASTANSGYLADVLTNIVTVKSFGKELYEDTQARELASQWHAASSKLKWGVLGATGAYSVFLVIIRLAALLFAVYIAQKGIVSVGIAYLLLAYSLDVSRQLWEINSIVRTYNRVVGDAYDMTEILETPYELIDNSKAKLVAPRGNVEFKHVSFAHDGGAGEHVFDDFTLSIPAGQRVGIVGHSGSGKTTLTRILLRFSDIQFGSISIDNQDIAAVTQQSLHETVAYVPQEPLLFHRTLRENITYAQPSATPAELDNAAKRSHALEFIEKLPHGLDTIVGERGVKLSGGQRQRIAIARAILKDAPILVLDEATSALDSESEGLIQKSLETLMKGRTSIVIAHRLSTIAKLDRIIVLDQGKIVEDGSHTELLKQDGIYASLWAYQSGGFIEE